MWFGFNCYFPTAASLAQTGSLYGNLVRVTPHPNITHWREHIKRCGDRGIKSFLHWGYGHQTVQESANTAAWITDLFQDDPNVYAMGVGNEPNMAKFNPIVGRAFTPQEAANYHNKSHQAARTAGWTKPIVIEGPARIGGRTAWIKYLEDMFKAGLPEDCPLEMHPYPEGSGDEGTGGTTLSEDLASVKFQVQTARNILRKYSGHNRYWAGEWGYGTSPNGGFSWDKQRKRGVALAKHLRSLNVHVALWWTFADDRAPEPDEQYDWYGVTKFNYDTGAISYKPVYHALKTELGFAP